MKRELKDDLPRSHYVHETFTNLMKRELKVHHHISDTSNGHKESHEERIERYIEKRQREGTLTPNLMKRELKGSR